MTRVLEDALAASWTLRRKPLESFMLPQAAIGDGMLACSDGSLVSLICIDGVRSMTGAEELERFVELACRRLNSCLAAPGHALHLMLERAPDEAGKQVERICARAGTQASRLGLSLSDVLDERSRYLGTLLAAETVIFACWTRPACLTAAEARRGRKRLRQRLKAWLPEAGEAQCPDAVLDGLEPRHRALMDAVGALFDEAGIVAERLDDEAALRTVRVLINGADSTAPDWRPVTPLNERETPWSRGTPGPAPARVTEPPETGAFPPPLAPQFLVRDPLHASNGIRIGGRLYGAMDMVLGPRGARPFAEMMEGLAEAKLPCRFSILIEGGGMRRLGAAAARVSSAFLAFSHPDSRAVRDAMRALAEQDAAAQAVVRLRIGMLTWVGAQEDGEELARRLGRLQQVAEGWGECVFSPLVGDPLEAFAASVPGFCCGGTAEPALAPLSEALRLLPVCRPAALARSAGTARPGGSSRNGGTPRNWGTPRNKEAPWSAVDHIFRAPDGRMLPFSCTGGEDHGFELIHGIPGRGKSVLMNSLTLAHLLQGGQARLPLSATIDIGPSSSGLISLIHEALPPERRAEAGWFPLRMSTSCAINPCDTQLGCRSPLPAERAFLENLLGLILTPANATGVPDGMRELIGPTVDRAYGLRSDAIAGAEPNVYTPGRDGDVDRALERAGLAPSDLPWWEVVDLLFDAGDAVAASRAQRYAVPVLGDFLAAVREPAVQGLVGEAVHGAGGETVTRAFIRIFTSLAGSWPAMFAPTAFDTGAARVAAIDLREVAPRGSAEADRQTAAFYMLARHALTRHWWIGEEDIDQAPGRSPVPERYRAWHRERLREIRETPKRLAFDEFHRTGSAPAVRAQVERDAREARKHGVRLCLASQRHEDFGPALVELANRIWVLGAGGKAAELEALSRVFDLSATVADAVSYRLTGPGPEGAPALLIATHPGGRLEQVLLNAPGPVELWALTTSPRDAALRERLCSRLAPAEARAALARRFPTGTAGAWIEAELRRLELRGARVAASESDLLDRLADELASGGTIVATMTERRTEPC